ncbi:bifunctional oligoribonuclease/PAP phosphatase NrnA [Aureibaculum sp. 2210JD6-5]|uniref:DHH family phosphoesterase n=1 Tax=Aureibaculum sp. 2210JD6-5 TaxID=3103957 RepID=UPI002AAE8E42|nr:bifunctional oligoribonuclease/PAP phosphatase NrnA [Aureibaculum sp. 2210JD6-5]MDY7395179.1 bifunctional oligoribonuclease/PAP phosphatase NrnA [Aureibaculum sp. 2210JD6-5]
MNSKEIQEIKQLLVEPKNIVIVSHRNPDGDAYGSSLALYHYLIKGNHTVTVVSPNDCPDFLKWLPNQDKIIVFDENVDEATKLLEDAEIVFTLDFNALHRVGSQMESVLEKINPIYIMIDHHEQPDDYAKYMFSDPSIASTSEMIYHFFDKLEVLENIDNNIASCIYTGIVTDTGSFKYPATSSITHLIVAKLMDVGIDHTKIHNRLYDTNSFNRLQLLGTALSNLKVLQEYRTAYITISQQELNSYDFKKGDTEGFVNYGLSVEGIVFAVIFIEDQKQDIIKMSLRSKGNFSVNDFARNHFNGGGHVNAAGGRSEVSLQETVKQFLEILPNYKNELENSYEY